MKKIIIAGIVTIGIFLLFFGSIYLIFFNLDFIGHKDPKTVEENVKREESKLLSAEFRNGTDYCEINLLDKTNIEINVGNSKTGLVLFEKYYISGDTIIIKNRENKYIKEDVKEYLNTNKLLIINDEILFELDTNKLYVKSKTMQIKFNEINQNKIESPNH